MYYYDTTDATSLSKDHVTRVKNATKKWEYKTNENGWISISDMALIAGNDETFKNSTRVTVPPVGAYVIEETYPPKTGAFALLGDEMATIKEEINKAPQ